MTRDAMTDGDAPGTDLPAGRFSSWLSGAQAAMRDDRTSEVPCGTCTACCRSSQFVHVAPDETDTLAHIPAALLFPAPGLPRGHQLLGYDERGHCPMLVDDRCSIYAHRPRTCRTYDCRVLAATGIDVDLDDTTKTAIAEQVRRWRFTYPTERDRTEQAAVRSAANFLADQAEALGAGTVPANPTQRAVAAIQLHELFLAHEPPVDEVRVELTRRR